MATASAGVAPGSSDGKPGITSATRYFDSKGHITSIGALRRHGFINGYTIANGLSFNLVSASFVLMYAIAYGADERYSGALSGVGSLAMVTGILSLFLLAIFGASRLMGYAWSTRYLFAAGLLLAPWVAAQPQFGQSGVLTLIFVCMLGFSVARGIGASAWLPLIHSMTTEENRMAFMTGNSLRFRIGATAGIIGAVFFLGLSGGSLSGGGDPNQLWWIILAGVCVGLLATVCLFLLPSPRPKAQRVPTIGQLKTIAGELWQRMSLRYFFTVVLILMAGAGLFQAQRVYYMCTVLGFSVSQVAWIDAVTMIGAALLLFPLRKAARRLGEIRLLRWVVASMVVVGVVFADLPPNVWAVGLALLVWNAGHLWVYLSVDRFMLAECDSRAILVVPVIWTSVKEFAFGVAAMGSGFAVHWITDLLPDWSLKQHYWLFDNLVMILLVAAVLLLTWSLKRYPLTAPEARLEPAA